MVSRWYPDGAYIRYLLPKPRLGPKQILLTNIKMTCLHPET